jgi:putative transposase
MYLADGHIYHVFNRGNNKQQIFYSDDNYKHFLKLVRRTIYTAADILAWCLMPNHFHFLVYANRNSVQLLKDRGIPRQRFSEQVKQLLSSYTKAINKQLGFTGSLFQQNTRALCVNEDHNRSYAVTNFHYLHQNPMKSGLVKRMEDWEYSSFRDYIGLRKGTLCNQQLACELLDLDLSRLFQESYMVINDEELRKMIDKEMFNS